MNTFQRHANETYAGTLQSIAANNAYLHVAPTLTRQKKNTKSHASVIVMTINANIFVGLKVSFNWHCQIVLPGLRDLIKGYEGSGEVLLGCSRMRDRSLYSLDPKTPVGEARAGTQ